MRLSWAAPFMIAQRACFSQQKQAERGLLDAEAVRVMARDYDQIMATVARASAPVAEAYRRVQEEYGWLVAQLKQRIPE